MNTLRALCALALASACAFAQTSVPFAGIADFSGAKIKPATTTFASLPAASSNSGIEYLVTDGNTTCTAGSGTTKCKFYSNGTSWFLVGAATTSSADLNTATNDVATAQIEDFAVTPAKQAAAVNAQTGTTYTVLNTDRGKLVTHTNASAIAVTLPQAGASSAFIAGWFADFQNRGVGTVTITPTTSTIDGVASLALSTAQGARIFSDGTNYFTQRGVGGGSGSGDVTEVQPATGISITNQTGPIPIVSVNTAVIQTLANAQSGAALVCSGSGTAGAETCTMTPTLTAYTDGQMVRFKVGTTNTTTKTLNVDTLGVRSILKSDGTALSAGDLTSGIWYALTYRLADTTFRLPAGASSSSSSARTVERNAGVCLSGAAGSGFSLPVSNAPTASCVTGTNANGAVLQYPDTGSYSAQDRMILTGTTVAVDIWWRANVANAALNAVWQLQTACVATDEDGDPSFNTAQTVTSAAHATANRWRKATISSVTMTGCASGEIMRYKLLRDSAHASDTLAATAELISVVWSIQ